MFNQAPPTSEGTQSPAESIVTHTQSVSVCNHPLSVVKSETFKQTNEMNDSVTVEQYNIEQQTNDDTNITNHYNTTIDTNVSDHYNTAPIDTNASDYYNTSPNTNTIDHYGVETTEGTGNNENLESTEQNVHEVIQEETDMEVTCPEVDNNDVYTSEQADTGVGEDGRVIKREDSVVEEAVNAEEATADAEQAVETSEEYMTYIQVLQCV